MKRLLLFTLIINNGARRPRVLNVYACVYVLDVLTSRDISF